MFTRTNETRDQLFERFCHSYSFLFIVSILFLFGWYFESGVTLVVASVLSVLVPLLLSKDGEILGSILLIGLFTIPTFPFFDNVPWYIYTEIGIFVVALIAFLIKKIILKDVNMSIGSLGIGLISFAVVLLIATIVRNFTELNKPSEYNSWGYLAYGMLALMILVYFIFHMTSTSSNTDLIHKTFYMVSFIVLIECIYALIMSKLDGASHTTYEYTKWGSRNTVALVLEICLPFLALIFSKNHYRVDTLIMILLSYMFIIGADSRGAMATSVLLVALLVFILFRNIRHRRYVIGSTILGLTVLFVVCYYAVPEIRYGIDDWFNNGLNLSERDAIWDYAYSYSKNNPFVGGGIQALFDMFPIFWHWPHEGEIGIWLCHSTFFTIIAAGGWLAILCYAYHLGELFVTTYKAKFYARDVLLYFILVGLLHGIVDNTFFNIIYMLPYFWIFSFKDFEGIKFTKKINQ